MILKSMVLLESSISQHGWYWKVSNFVLGWIRERILRDVVQQVVARDREMSYQHAWRVSVNLMFIELCWMISLSDANLQKPTNADRQNFFFQSPFLHQDIVNTHFASEKPINLKWLLGLEKLVDPTQYRQKRGQGSQPACEMKQNVKTEETEQILFSVLQPTSCFETLPIRLNRKLLLISNIHLGAILQLLLACLRFVGTWNQSHKR